MEVAPLASLSLTHVHYNPNDSVSLVCAWLALVPQALCVVYATLIWSSREVEVILMFIGQMGCEAFNFLLKRLIKEERPKQMNGKGYGMPSSHAQFATFFSLYISLFLLIRHTPNSSLDHTPLTLLQRSILSFLALLCALAVASSRTYLNYHTTNQVLIGCAAGAFSAMTWFALTSWLRRRGWIGWAIETEPFMIFRVRDLAIQEDLAEAGWQRWKERQQQKKPFSESNDALEKKTE